MRSAAEYLGQLRPTRSADAGGIVAVGIVELTCYRRNLLHDLLVKIKLFLIFLIFH
ncbi:hypothetical protein [Lewinella cohaerens]|uniref:hypothetical protein n=1 Tax=Lewinella cohaerens TaxID=70995 RepID=UPI0012EB5AAB|nr:hypothetical protein [Lewinella cohaerens]